MAVFCALPAWQTAFGAAPAANRPLRRQAATPAHFTRLSASLFGETVGEVHLAHRMGRFSTLTYRSNVLVVRDKARLRQEAFIEVTFDSDSGTLIHSVARRCSGPADGSTEPVCTPARTLDRLGSVPALAAEIILARKPDNISHCIGVTDEESGITGPACAVASTGLTSGVDVVGSKLGIEFTAHLEDGELVSLELPRQGARFERTSGAIDVSDEDLFAEPIPAMGDVPAALRGGRMRVKLYGAPQALKSLRSLTAPEQRVVGEEAGALVVETVQMKPPKDAASRRILDAAALLVAKARDTHADCQAAAAWFVNEARKRHWKVRPTFGIAYVDGRFAFHAWAIIDTPGGHVPVDPLLAQVPADAGHIQLAPPGEGAGSVLVSFHHGLTLEVTAAGG